MRRLVHTVSPESAGQRLDAVALAWLQAALGRSLSKAALRRLIMAGVVRVNGRPTPRPGLLLVDGSRLEATIDEHRLPPLADATAEGREVRVLYEDAALVAVAKPPGIPVHATADPSRADLFTLVRRQIGQTTGAPAYLGLHQRLDRDTSGVVVFTKSPDANASLARQFGGHTVEKVYHAITTRGRGAVARSWRVESALAQVGKGARSRVESVESGGASADTRFAVLERLEGALLVEARPGTGRKHQIRAHLREQDLPILGDVRYGGPTRVGDVHVPRTMLHATRLALCHPLSGRRLEIACPYPEDFARVLADLRGKRLPDLP